MSETWEDIHEFKGIYQVSNFGNVRSLTRFENSNVGERIRHGKNLSLRNTKGYKTVVLCKNGIQKTFYVHRLVAAAFIPKIEGKNDVNHKDGTRDNNFFENLEWCTHKENMQHACSTGLKKPMIGELHPQAKLSEVEVRDIRKRYVKRCRKNGTSAIAKEYGVSRDAIYDIVTNRNWKGVL